jgi:outer membrane protein OmpA-like peptidoglycan-associated protein
MRRFLLASVATAGLALSALPAVAQVPDPVPATPPITTPQPDADVTAQTDTATPSTADMAESALAGEANVQAQVPPADAAATAQAETTAPTATAQATTPVAPAPSVAAPATPVPTLQAQAPAAVAGDTALAVPVSATDVCAARTTSVHFGARGSALTRQNQNAIEHAADAASVCNLQQVTIVDSAEGRVSSRRAQAVRATLLRQGVPEERITVQEAASADAEAASTGRLDVRMEFAGAANGATQVAMAPNATGVNAAAQPTLETTQTPVAPSDPAVTPATPMMTPATPVAPDTATPPAAEPQAQTEDETAPGT